ncbi:hypothetical protein HPB50_025811 [Hyalomma asiaticum]|uniref:Uncharacterized protein n=1 Tax=Hyalomma asiaticum TaxID=266040 RepID=A0ACB7SR76_HYAAI|nr:hypothetical protein HPB50_025811 [Hyalomma asiaticum]
MHAGAIVAGPREQRQPPTVLRAGCAARAAPAAASAKPRPCSSGLHSPLTIGRFPLLLASGPRVFVPQRLGPAVRFDFSDMRFLHR